MRGFIRLEYGKNACGLTSFLSYVSTTVYFSTGPLAKPSSSPVSASPTKKPSSSTLATNMKSPSTKTTRSSYRNPSNIIAPSLAHPIRFKSQRLSQSSSYSYIDQFIPPSVQAGGRTPVHYYSSHVLHYYSPKPSSAAHAFVYYGTAAPTVTHRPTGNTLGRFGYSDEATPKPSKLPLVYYGDFQKIHTPTVTPTSSKITPFYYRIKLAKLTSTNQLLFRQSIPCEGSSSPCHYTVD